MSPQPVKLRSDNFTPPMRTPWGGKRIMAKYKRAIWGNAPGPEAVGESWEVSVEPSFPSCTEFGETLTSVIARDPAGWLGARTAALANRQLPLLVKLVDAGQPLSVQVHPRWRDRTLTENESGKLELWLILDADQGSGIYLGFREGVDEAIVRSCLEKRGPLDELMNFIPVRPGETFAIRPGTPHALGKGVTLVEPQILTPPKVATTYRYWDWNRLYDEFGQPSPNGKSRIIDVARSLAVTDWTAPRGGAFVESCRIDQSITSVGDLECTVLPAECGLSVRWWRGSGTASIRANASIIAITCVGGSVQLEGLAIFCGESAVVPAAMGDLRVELHAATLIQTEVDPVTLAGRGDFE